ncbi:MAG: HD domain-containing protein [Prolixibacteraceae bacterium]|nr:HD domain-containing protein [Prolixibacteraceae bacterium]
MKLLETEKNRICKKTETFVKTFFEADATGHDWWHIYRVRKLALAISETEKGDKFIIEMAALLHDVDDYKISGEGDNLKNASAWLKKAGLPDETANKILTVIGEVSFKGNDVEDKASTSESKIVQDADRLDAIGAIGIARAFAYGGSKNRALYNPDEKPATYKSFEEYRNNKSSTISHFYEKLLLLKDRMKTNTGKLIASERHKYLENYLKQFFNEWNVNI